jgi:hypothetical protein
MPDPIAETFQEKVCRHFDVPAERYEETVLSRTLYPHARWLRGVGSGDMFAADRSFVAGVGRLTRWSGFAAEASDFQHDSQNRRFWRRSLRLRVSVERMRVLFSEIWGESNSAVRRASRTDDSSSRHSSLPTG